MKLSREREDRWAPAVPTASQRVPETGTDGYANDDISANIVKWLPYFM